MSRMNFGIVPEVMTTIRVWISEIDEAQSAAATIPVRRETGAKVRNVFFPSTWRLEAETVQVSSAVEAALHPILTAIDPTRWRRVSPLSRRGTLLVVTVKIAAIDSCLTAPCARRALCGDYAMFVRDHLARVERPRTLSQPCSSSGRDFPASPIQPRAKERP
jgi:hypothetical protein